MRTPPMLALLAALATPSAGPSQDAAGRGPKRPNVVLLMADDLGWGDVGFNGGEDIRTPELDRMAAAGVTFERFYSAAPVCSPTRGSCLTGRHPMRYGIPGANAGHLKPEELDLAELLRANGYTTGHFGKWHLGTLTRTVVESNRGGPRGAAHYAPPWEHGFDRCFSTEAKVPTWDPMRKPGTAEAYGTHYWTGPGQVATDGLEGDDSRVIMDRALDFMRGAAKAGRPFFAVVWFHAPHLPVVAGPDYLAMYPDGPERTRNYRGCVTALDDQVGRLRAELRALGVAGDTLLAFCSDNGPEGRDGPGSAGPFRGRKRSLYEGGVRVPAVFEWPGRLEAGRRTAFPAVTSDYLPTVAALCGIERPGGRPLDGIDLSPALLDGAAARGRAIGFDARRRSAWIEDRYKLVAIRPPGGGDARYELYDLASDQAERDDLAAREPGTVARMARALADWRASCEASARGDDYPVRADDRPNVVIVLADDLGIGDLGAYNRDSKIPTPHLDAIARAGMRFDDMHSPSAVCTPTRYGLLTGRYAWRSRLKRGVLNGYSPALIEPGRATIASALGGAGYRTAGFGKWHLGLGNAARTDYSKPLTPGPNAVGFGEFYGIPASLDMAPYVYVQDRGVAAPPTGHIDASAHRRQDGGGFWRAGAIASGFRHVDVLGTIVDKALDSIARTGEDPFFLYVALSAPHTPWLPIEEFRGRSEAGYYGDFVAMVDAQIGRLDAALRARGLTDDTLLVVTSDNGSHWPVADIQKWGHRANLDYRGQKADIHEGGHRVPFLVRWPGVVEARSRSAQTACLTDLFATIAAVVGVDLPDDTAEDSFDLSPILRGDRADVARAAVVHHSVDGMFAIRDGSWKLIAGRGSGGFTAPRRIPEKDLGPNDPRGQLYDLEADPGETQNLWLERPEIVARLMARLDELRAAGRSRPAGN